MAVVRTVAKKWGGVHKYYVVVQIFGGSSVGVEVEFGLSSNEVGSGRDWVDRVRVEFE